MKRLLESSVKMIQTYTFPDHNRAPAGAAEGCDLLTVSALSKSKIKRSQPSAAPTGDRGV
jgi:hypothetical protein